MSRTEQRAILVAEGEHITDIHCRMVVVNGFSSRDAVKLLQYRRQETGCRLIRTALSSWKKLLMNEDIEPDTAEFETDDYHKILQQSDENAATLPGIELWIEKDVEDPSNHILTD
ncbi:hypothetical protein NPIL_375661 [Nephila pilipes]|uniref:Uncharacterized protein n=1 Tax=Nephila pilipes TaxID=299642 RepID=A0A8X6MVR6_NEPPI|nr:hypothetical protein NPIL_375661 [Nephila pilipes]